MLPRRTLTKKQKKHNFRKRLAVGIFFSGLVVGVAALFYLAFFQKPPEFLNPLSKDQTSAGIKIAQVLKEKNILYKSVTTSKDLTYKIMLSKDSEVIIDPKKDIELQLSSLQLILKRLKIEGKTFRRLDFRYQKPIISF